MKNRLITNKNNILYLSGFAGSAAHLLMKGKKGFLFTDGRYRLLAEKMIPKNFSVVDMTEDFETAWKDFLRKYKIKKLGIEEAYVSLAFWKKLKKWSAGVKLADDKNSVEKLRICKKPFEIERIKKAQSITDKTFAALKKWLKPGVSEKDIGWKINEIAHCLGTEGMAFPPIVAINKNSACPHHKNTDKKLAAGDMILIDMGAKFRGYCSDMTRMIFTAAPAGLQAHIYDLVLFAQQKAIENLKSGVAGAKIDKISRSAIKKAGYGKEFSHSLGHGVGLDIHELPNLNKKGKDKIPAGAIVTVEPGIYLDGKFGVRIEDMLLVGKNSSENLTATPKSLKSLVINI